MFTPTVVKLLKHLKDNQVRNTKEQLVTIIEEEEQYVNKALEKLVATNIVSEEGGFYYYKSTPQNEKLSSQLLEVYQTVSQKPAKELLIRGLICQVPSQYLFQADTLFEVIKQEGVTKREFDQFLQQEEEKGYLKRVKVIYIGLDPYSPPVCIPPYYFYYLCHLGIIDRGKYNRLKEGYKDYELREVDYIIARYPPEIATPAKEYIERGRKEIRDNLRRKGLHGWLWFW